MKLRLTAIGRFAVVAALGLTALLGGHSRVSAHASYDHSNPSDKQVLATAPSQLMISFVSKIVSDPATFAFVSLGDNDVTSGPATISPSDPKTLVVPLKPNLANGKYDVFWKSTDADDSGVTFGHFTFFVGRPSPADVAAAASGVSIAVPDGATEKALTNAESGPKNCGYDSWCNYCARHPDAAACGKKGG